MNLPTISLNRHAHRRTFGPVVFLTLFGLALLVAISIFLINKFDASAADREQRLVENGLNRQIGEFDEVVATQVDWDGAVRALDHKFDSKWADFNVGNYLHTFNGFTHAFVLDSRGRPIYAATNGERAPISEFWAFSKISHQLLPAIRKAERERGPPQRRAGKDNLVIPAIQANSFKRVNGQVYLVIATLVQPDFGVSLPKGPQAPVVIAAKPLDQAMLRGFGQRYLLDGVEISTDLEPARGRGWLPLMDPGGGSVAALTWDLRQPGTMLFDQIKVPLLTIVVLLLTLGMSVMRRGASAVRELVASEERASHLAYHDPLTGLPNRALLFNRLATLLGNCGIGPTRLAVLCVDLDRFKDVNDTLGHHAGDLVIEAVAERLRQTCGPELVIARLGGDEFVVLAEFCDDDWLGALCQRILTEVGTPIESDHGRIEVGCSIGLAVIDQPGIAPSEALRWADLALYRSKELGRGCMTRFETEMDNSERDRRALEQELRLAIADGDLRMVYQPQVDRDGNMVAVEGLLRWDNPKRGPVSPAQFVPLAEESGLILALGEFAIRRVLAESRDFDGIRIAINVSAVQLRLPGFAALVTRLVAEAGVDPTNYEIELTETALLAQEPAIAANVEILKRLGFSIALDDFGTGYSSMSVLQRFAVDRIKIDRSFTSNLGESEEAEALVVAMVKLARALSLDVIAEGVESKAQMERLIASGCLEFQGHLLGMPMEAHEIVGLLGGAGPRAIAM